MCVLDDVMWSVCYLLSDLWTSPVLWLLLSFISWVDHPRSTGGVSWNWSLLLVDCIHWFVSHEHMFWLLEPWQLMFWVSEKARQASENRSFFREVQANPLKPPPCLRAWLVNNNLLTKGGCLVAAVAKRKTHIYTWLYYSHSVCVCKMANRECELETPERMWILMCFTRWIRLKFNQKFYCCALHLERDYVYP